MSVISEQVKQHFERGMKSQECISKSRVCATGKQMGSKVDGEQWSGKDRVYYHHQDGRSRKAKGDLKLK